MRKTYVGVKKTPLDANHIFYASFDGTTVPEVGSAVIVNSQVIEQGPTGAAMKAGANQGTGVTVTAPTGSPITMEGFFNITNSAFTGDVGYLLFLSNASTSDFVGLCIVKNSNNISLRTPAYVGSIGQVPFNSWNHLRLIIIEGEARVYLNGKLIVTLTLSTIQPSKYTKAVFGYETGGWGFTGSMADISVSKVDRGATFATLPADFIQGYADITPALSYQRRINSDAQTSQKSFVSAKVKNQTQERSITVTKGSGSNTAAWEAGDRIKVRGIAGDIISGVIDADTAIARIMEGAGDLALTSFRVDDVSRLAVNDNVAYYNPTTGTDNSY